MYEAFTDGRGRDWDTGNAETVRLAVVGCGGFARNAVLPAIVECEYAEATVGVSGSAESREAVAERFDLATTDYDGYAAGDLEAEYDAVYVATPNRLHLPHVETAADRGKAVICEKPLEVTTERAERAVETCADAGVPLMTAYRLQADPLYRRLREFIADGGIGPVSKLAGDFTVPALTDSRGPEQWRLDQELAGGGALVDLGVYPLNAARFLLGEEPAWVDGHTRTSEPYAPVDEHVAFEVGFPDAVGSFTASFSGYPNADFTVYGEDGVVRVHDAFQPDHGRQLLVDTPDGRVTVDGLGGGELSEEFDYFAHAVSTGADIEPDGADGVADVELMAAVYEQADR